MEEITFVKIKEVADKLLFLDEAGQFYLSKSSEIDFMEGNQLLNKEDSLDQINIPPVFELEKVKFESIMTSNGQNKELVIYQVSEKEIEIY